MIRIFLRVCGISALLGGFLLLSAPVSQAYCSPTLGTTSSLCSFLNSSYLISSILLLLGTIGIYIGHSAKAGKYGLFSFLVAFLAGGMYIGAKWMNTFVEPALLSVAPEIYQSDMPPMSIFIGFMTTYPLLIVGWLLFGISIIKTNIFSRWAALLVIVGYFLDFVPLPIAISPVIVGIGMMGLGFALVKYTSHINFSETIDSVEVNTSRLT